MQDAAYDAWRLALPAAVRATLVGLRVRWRWTSAQMRQAPDTAEFRVYYNGIAFPPGAPPAPPAPTEPDLVATAGWAERVHVTSYGADFVPEADGSRTYEVILPRPDSPPTVFPGGLPLAPSLAEPVAYAYVGVSAADDRLAVDDDPKWNAGAWGHHPGNESRASSPAKIHRVWRQAPPVPAVPPDSERVFATPADYHSRSYYTYRWRPQPLLRAHVCRAVDESVFTLDWTTRAPHDISAGDDALFPDAAIEPHWTAGKRQQVAAEINQFSTLPRTAAGRQQALPRYRGPVERRAAYPRLAADVRARFRAIDDRAARSRRPGQRRSARAPTTGTITPPIRTCGSISTRSMAAPTTAISIARCMSTRPATAASCRSPDRRYGFRMSWRRARRRCKPFRAETGRSPWPGPSNRERDLVAYRVYRAESTAAAHDIRSMTLVHTEPVAAGEPAARPGSVTWTDTPLPGLTPFYYRVTAIDDADNESVPTPMATGRAVDAAPPNPAAVDGAAWLRIEADGTELPFAGASVSLPPAVRIKWAGPAPDFEYLVQRRSSPGELWQSRAPWTRQSTYLDLDVDATLDYEFRVLTRKPTNKMTSASPAVAAEGK